MRSIRIAVFGLALAGLWSTASGLRGAIIKVEYDFSNYPAVPFTLQGGIARSYQHMVTGVHVVADYPATITAAGMQAQLQFPGWPYMPLTNPEAHLSGAFHAAVIGFQIVWGPPWQLTAAPHLFQQTGSAWTFADVLPLLDFAGTNHFAAEGNYLTHFSVYEIAPSYGVAGIKLYIDTSVNVPDGSPQGVWFALLGALLLAGRMAASGLNALRRQSSP